MTNYSAIGFTHYKLEDNRVWDVFSASFVSSLPHGAIWRTPVANDGSAGEKGLKECLLYLGLPLGELKDDEDYAAEARAKRNALIAETDYLAMPDYPLDDEKKAAVLAYRQALRDIPEQAGFPRQIDWPVKP